jgi:hypothetical protein
MVLHQFCSTWWSEVGRNTTHGFVTCNECIIRKKFTPKESGENSDFMKLFREKESLD